MPTSKRRSSGGASTPSKPSLEASSPARICDPRTPVDIKSPVGSSCVNVGFKATVVAVDGREVKGRALLWMSEAAMLAAPVATGSLISVSVVVACAEDSGSNSGSLESLHLLCKTYAGVEVPFSEASGAQIAIAIAWPSRKLVRNEVRVSRVLASTLGSLPIGSTIALKSLAVQSSRADLMNGSTGRLELGGAMPAVLYDCAHLSLQWCPPSEATLATGSSFNKEMMPLSSPSQQTPKRKDADRGRAASVSPVNRSPFSDVQGCTGTPTRRDKIESGNLHEKREALKNWSSVRTSLEKGKEKVKSLLETFAVRWITGRHMLPGNLVHIPLCGCDCIFLVTETQKSEQNMDAVSDGSERMVACSHSSSDQHKITAMKEVSLTPSLPLAVYLVGHKTTITLLPPLQSGEQVMESVQTGVGSSAAAPRLKLLSNSLAADVDRIEYSELGGLSVQINKLKQHVELSLLHPEYLMRYGLQPVRGVLLHGPPGTGKSSLARAAACEAGVRLFAVNGPEIVSEFYGESEASLRAVFASAAKEAPSVVFIDELDAIVPARKDGSEELGQRMVATLLTLMDGGGKEALEGVLVVAASNRIDAIDPALRRPGRFDIEIEIGVPSPSDRGDILQVLLQSMQHNLMPSDVVDLAATTHGFVGADLAALCNEAAMSALRRSVHLHETNFPVASLAQSFSGLLINPEFSKFPRQPIQESEWTVTSEGLYKLTLEDFKVAKTKVRPSAMREVALEVPNVRWSDIGGQEDIKQKLKEIVEWPQKQCGAIARMGVDPPRGVLLYGPPGCSKTLMARAVASETGLNFIAVKGPELFSKWVGESEKAVQTLFARARAAAPSVVFFDEIDGLAVKRESAHGVGVSVGDRVMSQLLTEMDGLVPMKGVSVIAATNRLDIIDEALLRPGRFDRVLYVGPPDEAAREQIFGIHLRNMPCDHDVSHRDLATRSMNYTGADISAVCQEAAMAALEEDLEAKVIKMYHFDLSLARVKPSESFCCYKDSRASHSGQMYFSTLTLE